MDELNEQQKIELGKYIRILAVDHFFLKMTFVELADNTLNKIQELTQDSGIGNVRCSDGFLLPHNLLDDNVTAQNNTKILQSTPPDDKETHVCGVCYQDYSPDFLKEDFDICPGCRHSGKTKIECQDKNGSTFTAGDTLRNEISLTSEIKILRIDKSRIVTPIGVFEIQDFVDAGWIVHERVTPFEIGPTNFGLTKCRFKSFMIGDPQCIISAHCEGVSDDQQWVTCELYNKKDEDGK